MSTTILLVDDHQILRQGLRILLTQLKYEVVGEAADGREAVALAGQLKPDVVVMDLSMPQLNGVDATRQLCAAWPSVKVIALTAHSDRKMMDDVLKAGATGYLVKDSAAEELVAAIETVLAGETYLSPRVAALLVQHYVRSGSAPEQTGVPQLTHREREVLQLMAEGKATKQVASMLRVSVKTVETHRRRIMEKLQLDSVAALTKYAIREGLTTLEV